MDDFYNEISTVAVSAFELHRDSSDLAPRRESVTFSNCFALLFIYCFNPYY